MSENHRTDRETSAADVIAALGYDPFRRSVPVLHGTEADEMPMDVAIEADRDALRARVSALESALREALDGWVDAMQLAPDDRRTPREKQDEARIAELRKLPDGDPR